jgi:hypothetical protein
MKLLDLVLEYYDSPPDYPDPDGWGYYNEEYDDVENEFNLVFLDSQTGIFVTEHKTSKKKYLSHTDAVEDEFYTSDKYFESDYDEDGPYTYERFDKDNMVLSNESLTMYATISYTNEDIGIDFDQWESGVALIELGNIFLRDAFLHDKHLFRNILNQFNKLKMKNK